MNTLKKFVSVALSAAILIFSGCGGIPPKAVKPDAPKVEETDAPQAETPKVETAAPSTETAERTEVIYKIGVDVPEGRYRLVMASDSYFRIENADGELVMQGADYANPLVLIDGQRLTVWNGDIKFVEQYDNPTKPAPVAEAPAPRLTAEEFDARFLDVINSAADAVGAAGMDGLGTPDRRVEGGRDVLIYSLDRDLTMSESTSAGAIKRVELNLTNVTRDNLLMTLIAFDAAARAFSDDADINAIHRALGLGGDLADMIKPHSATLNGIKYAKNVVGKNAMTFSISE